MIDHRESVEKFLTDEWRKAEAEVNAANPPGPSMIDRIMRNRPIRRQLAIATRLAGITAILFPLWFSIGWLYQAGFLLGSDVNLALVAPDPSAVAVSAFSWTVLAMVAFASFLLVHWLASRIPDRVWLGLEILIPAMAGIALVYGFVAGLNTEDIVLALMGTFLLIHQAKSPVIATLFTRREVIAFGLAVVFLGAFPAGWLAGNTIWRAPEDDRQSAVITLHPIPGLAGEEYGGACLYRDLVIVAMTDTRLIVRRPHVAGAWLIPMGEVTSISPAYAGSLAPSPLPAC